jgi:hypothetical protein
MFLDIDGAVDMASTLTVAGAAILNGGIDINGNLTIDVDGTTITLADGGVNFGQFYNNSAGTFNIVSPTQDKDIVFRGNDGGSGIIALTLDISNAGAATFNSSVTATSLDISGDVDIDGTLETDALSIASTTVTATAAELNFTDGVTSNIQTQLNTKTTPGFALAMAVAL